MKPKEFDTRIIQAVRALRELRQLKLINLANELGMTESNYCKIERGYKTISMGQLKVIAGTLDVSIFLILALAESERLSQEKLVSLSEIILQFVESVKAEGSSLTDEEVLFLLQKIKEPNYQGNYR
jgi:transcriptional regulator with XRE-family HTH domain